VTQRKVVLCVDDERIVLSGLRDQLRRAFGAGLLVELAESGEEGLEVIEELREDGDSVALVISDQLMPGMRGEAFLAEVHKRDPRALNILLTGQASADAVGAAVNNARLYRYIAKPWSESDLVLTVREALRSYDQAREIERQEAEARRAHQASLRFVPREFLALLGRDALVDVRFGDHVLRPMHILFTDMREYTARMETLAAADAFSFINEYVQRLDACIRRRGGFVGNLEGDAVLALFPGDADDAVAAGVDCHREIQRFSDELQASGARPVGMGAGVNSGPLLLGTVGGEDRLKCDVVGDAVNLASRVESLTKKYGTPMLISGSTRAELKQPRELRHVDRVQVKGKRQAVDLYEVLDALPDDLRQRRVQTRALFEEGGRLLRAGDLAGAGAQLRRVVDEDPDDSAARLLAARCQRFDQGGLPDDWSGVVRLDHK